MFQRKKYQCTTWRRPVWCAQSVFVERAWRVLFGKILFTFFVFEPVVFVQISRLRSYLLFTYVHTTVVIPFLILTTTQTRPFSCYLIRKVLLEFLRSLCLSNRLSIYFNRRGDGLIKNFVRESCNRMADTMDDGKAKRCGADGFRRSHRCTPQGTCDGGKTNFLPGNLVFFLFSN